MVLNKLEKTCSMAELGNVGYSDLSSLSEFRKKLSHLVSYYWRTRDCFAVIYNSTITDRDYLNVLKAAGFSKLGKGYYGDSGKNGIKVFTWIKTYNQ